MIDDDTAVQICWCFADTVQERSKAATPVERLKPDITQREHDPLVIHSAELP